MSQALQPNPVPPSSKPEDLSSNPEPGQHNPPKAASHPPTSGSSEKLPRGLVEYGEFNRCVVVLGKPGVGKSQWAVRHVLELARIPCYVVAHDIGWKIPYQLHDGAPTHVKRYNTADEARAAINKDPRGIHAISSSDAQSVYELARELGRHSLEQNNNERGTPCVLLVDEIVSAGICDPNYLDEGFKKLLAERRHHNVAIVVTCQTPRLIHNQVLNLSTEVVLFRIKGSRDYKYLVNDCDLDDEVVSGALNFPDHEFVRISTK